MIKRLGTNLLVSAGLGFTIADLSTCLAAGFWAMVLSVVTSVWWVGGTKATSTTLSRTSVNLWMRGEVIGKRTKCNIYKVLPPAVAACSIRFPENRDVHSIHWATQAMYIQQSPCAFGSPSNLASSREFVSEFASEFASVSAILDDTVRLLL